MNEDRRPDQQPLHELPFARALEADLLAAAADRADPVPSAVSPRRRPRVPVLVRRTAILVGALALTAIVPIVTSVVLSNTVDGDGIPRATADLPTPGAELTVVPMGEANTYFDVEVQTAPAIGQSVVLTDATRLVAVEVSMTPPTMVDGDGNEVFAPDGPGLPATSRLTIWQAGRDVELGDEVDLRSGFKRVAAATTDQPLPRQGALRIELDTPVVLTPGAYMVVFGYELEEPETVLLLGVGGRQNGPDGSLDVYPNGQAYRFSDRGSDRLWFVAHETGNEEDGLPTRGDLQLFLRTR